MSAELFPPESVAVDSPRLQWIARHEVITGNFPGMDESTWLAGFKHWWGKPYTDDAGAFFCHETGHNGDCRLGEGDTEDEAIAHLCRRHRVPLWNEEPELRERWMRANGIRSHKRPNCWTVWQEAAPMNPFTAQDLDDALAGLAAKLNIKTWNE